MNNIIEFTAQVIRDIGRRDAQIQRALQVLQNAQLRTPDRTGDMVHCENGDYVDADAVKVAIKILQEGQQFFMN